MKILIVGLGLIGASIAKSLKKYTSHIVVCYDIADDITSRAVDDGVIDTAGTIDNNTYDMIVLCLHTRIAKELVHDSLPSIASGTILVDTCGLKGYVVHEWTAMCLPYSVRYVGTHPMAGREKSGYDASITDLFLDANLIITPVENTDRAALDTVQSLAKEIGFGKIVTATPAWHDNMIAYTSQLAHIVSSAYVKDFCMEDAVSFSGGSFQDMTRVATMDPAMWSELFLDNRNNLLYHLDLLLENLSDYRDALKARDDARLKYLIAEGRQIQEENIRRRDLEKSSKNKGEKE